MAKTAPSITALLDLAASTEIEAIRQRAVERIAAGFRHVPRRTASGLNGVSECVEYQLDRFEFAGIPATPRALHPDAVALARALLDLDDAGRQRIIVTLGVVEAATLAQSLERSAAADVVRALTTVRDRIGPLAHLAPNLSPEGLNESIRRFTALVPRGFGGVALVRALGRSLLSSLLVQAEPDVVAALARCLPLIPVPDTSVDGSWFAVAAAIVADDSISPR